MSYNAWEHTINGTAVTYSGPRDEPALRKLVEEHLEHEEKSIKSQTWHWGRVRIGWDLEFYEPTHEGLIAAVLQSLQSLSEKLGSDRYSDVYIRLLNVKMRGMRDLRPNSERPPHLRDPVESEAQ